MSRNHKHRRGILAQALRSIALAATACACTAAGAATGPLLDLGILATVPRIEVDRDRLQAALNEPPAVRALRYAADVRIDVDSTNSGSTRSDGTRATWRVALHSTDARTLSARLSHLQLPAGSELSLLDGNGLRWHGPYTAADIASDGTFHTPVVPGDTLLLELSAPIGSSASLTVASAQHGFKALNDQSSAGECNNNVACAKADAWTDAVRASAMITIGNQYSCSAVLLNNTRENGDPLLLTASHCGIERDGDLSDDSVVVYWNYHASGCTRSGNGRLDQNQTGTTLLATNPDSDFTLVRLNQRPAEEFNVFYAGWDATRVEPRDGASVHYPRADEARISFYDSAYAATGNVDGQRVASWVVQWNDGITEPGSSGSGLWNADHRIVGQLSGGNSSCEDPDGLDLFGRMDASWSGGSNDDERLQPWLDPDGVSSRVFDGYDPQSGSSRANDDSVITRAPPTQTLLLDPLANDVGAPPLTLVSAQADSGRADVVDNRIIYAWADGETAAEIDYLVRDRNGETQTATLRVQRLTSGVRGGSLSPLAVLLLIAGWRFRRR